MLTLTVFLIVMGDQITDWSKEEDIILLKDIGYALENEIGTASYLEDGYSREFVLPEKIKGEDYQVNITGNYLTVSSDDYEFLLNIPKVEGQPRKGNNTINKTDGIVYLN